MTRQYGLLAGVCCVSGIWEAKSLSVLVFLPSLYLLFCSLLSWARKGSPSTGTLQFCLALYGGDTRISYTAH